MERFVKSLFFISVLVLLGMTMYVYALLPDTVVLPNSYGAFSLSKDMFFYTSMGSFLVLVTLISFLTFLIKGMSSDENSFFDSERKDKFIAWSSSLNIILSVFYTMSISFIGMFQNDEHFDITNFAFLVYIGPVLIFIWLLSIFFVVKK